MPHPTPSDGESQEEFLDRCMGDNTMMLEFPDDEQRSAVCHQAWRDTQGGDEAPSAEG